MRISLERILNEFKVNKTKPFASDLLASFIRKDVPQIFRKAANINPRFQVQASAGQGNWAEVPWISIFDSSITTTAQKGYYIVYLFDSEMGGVYLSLNQGWTQYEQKFKPLKEARRQITRTSAMMRQSLKSQLDDFSVASIDLHSDSSLPAGYEAGHICGKYYAKGTIPSDAVLIEDLRNLIGVYRELKGNLSGKAIVDEYAHIKLREVVDEVSKDAAYQEEVEKEKEPLELPPGPVPKSKDDMKSRRSLAYDRNPRIALSKYLSAGYKCELDPSHATFISKATGKPYVESHHLIPVSWEKHFEYSLDVPENILVLCPLCHRKFHHLKDDERIALINKFYLARRELLKTRGIELELERLKDLLLLQLKRC